MSAVKAYTFSLNQLSQSGKDLIAYAQKDPASFGVCSILITAGLVTIIVPLAMGFTATGPGAGGLGGI